MKVEQLAVFLENKSGRLAAITKILSDSGINIRALSVADTADFGILRIIVDQTDKAKQVLKDAGFTVGLTDVVAVEVADKPGGLSEVLAVLNQVEINVEYMYAFVEKSGQNAVIIFRFDDADTAIEVLQNADIKILSGDEVRAI
jgi:hypothetical protein